MKTKKSKTLIRLLSLLLMISLLLSITPTISFATNNKQQSKPSIVSEDISLRSKFAKHFLMSDGSYMAISYPEAVHYNVNGTWEEIDNTLSNKEGTYSNANNNFPVRFTSANNEQMVRISSKGNQLSWSLKALTDSNVISGSTDSDITVLDTSSFALEMAENAISAINYSDVFGETQNISINYTVTHNKLEEDIIINEPGDIDSFRMDMVIGDLTAVVNNDNSITFFNNSEQVFHISPPYMCDAADNVLNDFSVKLSEHNGKLHIDYIPAKGWLEDQARVYPILFDPAITTTEYQSGIVDTYVAEGDTASHASEQRLYAGIKSNKIHRSYIKFTALPVIPESMPITDIELVLRNTNGSTTGRTFGVYKVSSAWNADTITYANQPSIGARLDTDDFDANDLFNTFSLTSEINSFYPEHFAGSNYGYMVRYTDESKTNPDYNAFYSTEHGTKSSRPHIKIYYSYSLPTCLITNALYTMQNAGSGKYLSVYNGTDANGTNVCQLDNDNTSKQQFRINSTTSGSYIIRANCSSNGTNRVLDISKSNGYVVDGCNVQIYTNVDQIAQEWVFIPTGLGFRISPRTNMSLALTAVGTNNGTSSGTSSNSAGNVYVSTYTASPYQIWYFYDANGNHIIPESTQFADGEYYFNNIASGKYLIRNVTNAYASSGTLQLLGNLIKWDITHINNGHYIIRRSDDATQYLAGSPYSSISTVDIQTCTDSQMPSYLKWEIYFANDGVVICNIASGQYLCEYNGEIYAYPYSMASQMNMYWRCASTNVYGNTTNHILRELDNNFSINNLNLNVGQSAYPQINKTPAGQAVAYANPEDFVYSASPSNVVTINPDTGLFTGNNNGIATITATHKVTGKSKTFTVRSLMNDFYPDTFYTMLCNNDITPYDIRYTDDGFFICTKSIADILNDNGIYNTVSIQPYTNGIQGFFDDWYIYCVRNGNSAVYGLYKMREEENDASSGYDNDNAGLSVSFVEFDKDSLTNCLHLKTNDAQYTLENAIRLCAESNRGGVHNTQLREYFINAQNEGSYLIAEYYVYLVVQLDQVQSHIPATVNYNALLEEIDETRELLLSTYDPTMAAAISSTYNRLLRIPNALNTINQNAGYNIFENNNIYLSNPNQLTYLEQYAILSMYTGCVNYFSLAAEVKVHALFLDLTSIPENMSYIRDLFESYEHALIADISLGEETVSGGMDSLYYNLDSYFVNEQEAYHGDKYPEQ